MGHKKMDSFKNVDQFMKHRKNTVKKSLSLGWEDSWVTDKNWLRKLDGFFNCKWCGKPMYGAEYQPGELILSCRTPLCPGNIDSGMANQIRPYQIDHRELTNQYLFNEMLQF